MRPSRNVSANARASRSGALSRMIETLSAVVFRLIRFFDPRKGLAKMFGCGGLVAGEYRKFH